MGHRVGGGAAGLSHSPGRSCRVARRRRERLLLWLPVIGKHVITPESPIASWATPAGLMSDADAAIVLVVRPAARTTLAESAPRQANATVKVFQCAKRPRLTASSAHLLREARAC